MKRFQGKAGKQLLRDALRQQGTLVCCEPAISKIAQVSKIQTYPANSRLIIQDSDDNDLAFILSGRVDILVKGQKVADRGSGQHVGEMSVVDPSARRSATVVASEQTVVAWVAESDFTKIAQSHPQLWRQLAVELADRLRQRGTLLRDRNPIPELFIGSSYAPNLQFLATADLRPNGRGRQQSLKYFTRSGAGYYEMLLE
jgi:CRP/FNR family transcriptional regulator, cyclic AMP receptor protein